MSIKSAEERPAATSSGFVYITIGLLGLVVAGGLFATRPMGPTLAIVVLAFLLALWCLAGLYMLQPNQAALLLLFGNYRGTDRSGGLRWANPFYSKTKISVRAHNFNSEKLKVNDLRGNPIEIAARTKIVQGAVGMVELALNGLAERGLLQLDDERRAAMVSNLLVVLCSDHDATPVINTGTLYT